MRLEVESRHRNPTRCYWDQRFWRTTGIAFAQMSMIKVDIGLAIAANCPDCFSRMSHHFS
eukprot:15340567-Ditylum_brightwellii.AAC.1